MNNSSNTQFSSPYFYALSKLFERAGYYGLRVILVVYMIGEGIQMERGDALALYGLFTGALVFSQILGAIIGDLAIGHRKAILVGGVIQSIGAFCLCIPSTIGLYLGLIVIVLGNGFFTPNLVAGFGKKFLGKTRKLDAGFSIFYLTINAGAFLGIMATSYLAEEFGSQFGFLIAGIFILLSIVPVLISNDVEQEDERKRFQSGNKNTFYVIGSIVVVATFWAVYEFAGGRLNEITMLVRDLKSDIISDTLLSNYTWSVQLPILVFLAILWSYVYNSQLFKMMLGFIIGAIGYGVIFLIQEIPSELDMGLYLSGFALLGLAELLIAPIVMSVITQYGNPKFLAINMSLYPVATKIFSQISILFGVITLTSSTYYALLAMIVLGVIAIIIVVLYVINKTSPRYENEFGPNNSIDILD